MANGQLIIPKIISWEHFLGFLKSRTIIINWTRFIFCPIFVYFRSFQAEIFQKNI